MTAVTTAESVLEPGLFATLSPPVLQGSRCTTCSLTVFPCASACSRCASGELDAVALPTTGRVWTWTTQSYPPKPPFVRSDSDFEPFTVGYVDLGEVLVETRLLGPVAIDDTVALTLLGTPAGITFAFERTSS